MGAFFALNPEDLPHELRHALGMCGSPDVEPAAQVDNSAVAAMYPSLVRLRPDVDWAQAEDRLGVPPGGLATLDLLHALGDIHQGALKKLVIVAQLIQLEPDKPSEAGQRMLDIVEAVRMKFELAVRHYAELTEGL